MTAIPLAVPASEDSPYPRLVRPEAIPPKTAAQVVCEELQEGILADAVALLKQGREVRLPLMPLSPSFCADPAEAEAQFVAVARAGGNGGLHLRPPRLNPKLAENSQPLVTQLAIFSQRILLILRSDLDELMRQS